MRRGIKLYIRLVKASVRSLMQYKFSFIVTFLLQTVLTVADFLVVLTILYHFRALGGWNLYQVGVLYGVTSSSVALYRTFCNEIHNFQEYIIRGEFDNLLLRPWPTLLVLMSRQIQFFRLGGVLQGMIALFVSLHYLGGAIELGWWKYLYILCLPLLGAVIYFAVGVAVSSLAFWTGRVRDIQVFAIYAPGYACSYPLSIYPIWLRAILLILPVGFIGYVPLRSVFGLGAPVWHLFLPVLIAAASVWCSLALWRLGERAYHSSGS